MIRCRKCGNDIGDQVERAIKEQRGWNRELLRVIEILRARELPWWRRALGISAAKGERRG